MTHWHQYGKEGRTPTPCATCGRPSDGWFADGSPKWAAHGHAQQRRSYYSDAFVTLYHGDAAEIGPELPTADVLVMDPPFDKWETVGASVDGRTVIAFTTWQHRDPVVTLFGRPRTELIWSFDDGRWVSHNLPRITHETILVFGPTGSVYVGPETDGVSVRKGTGSIGRDEMGLRTYTPHDRKALNSVLRFPRNVSAPLGVWSKPIELMQQLLGWCQGELVIDPYAGSGTTLVAAKSLGRKSIGIEIDERACEIAANRCRQEVLGLIG